MCLSHLIYTVRLCLIHICHAVPTPCSDHAVLLKATAQHGRREMACGLPARVRLLPATMQSSTKIVIRSIPILLTTIHYYYYFKLRTAAFKAYYVIWVRRSNFRHQASPRVSPSKNTQQWKVELWARNVQKFCLNGDFHITFRDLLHAVKLRHGTDGFTSPPKEGVLRIFSP